MTLTLVNPDTDPCLAAFMDEMRSRRIKAERDESGPNMFKDPRIETMWEGFVCGWIMRGYRDAEGARDVTPITMIHCINPESKRV
jgi:hypothetical protein